MALIRFACCIVLSMTLSSCGTLVGVAGGGIYAQHVNSDVEVQSGKKPRMSIGGSMTVGGGIGAALDLILIGVMISRLESPNS